MHRILCLSLFLSSAAFAAGEFRICQDVKKGTQVIFVDAGEKFPLLGLFRSDSTNVVDFVEADVCEKKDALGEDIRANIADPGNVIGACVSITNDAGDGILAILREIKPSKFQLERKNIEVEKPNKMKGKLFDCR